MVVAIGADVTRVKEGDRVGVPWLYSACGHCEHCLGGWETVRAEAQFGGYTRNGGFAEYILADPGYVAHIPDGLTAAAAAPIICAGVTTYKGLKQTDARPGEWVAIPSGVGGLGHLAIQYAKAMGLEGSARSTSTPASSRTPSASAPTRWSTPPMAAPARRSCARPMAAPTAC